MSEFILGKYIDTLLFKFIRDEIYLILSEDRAVVTGLTEEEYRDVYFSTQDLMTKRSMMNKGIPAPCICLWRTSTFQVKNGWYGHSVMPRYFRTMTDDGQELFYRGRHVTYEAEYHIFACSYFLDYLSRFNDDAVTINFIRAFPLNTKGYLDDYTSRFEFKLSAFNKSDDMNEDTGTRLFKIDTTWEVSFTIPDIRVGKFLDRVNLYLNSEYVHSFPKEVL